MELRFSPPPRPEASEPPEQSREDAHMQAVASRAVLVAGVSSLLGATGLLEPEQLAAVRVRANESSFAEAIVAEGVAAPDGFARTLASRYQLPYVDLADTGVSNAAASVIAQRVLERAVAVPYWLEGDRLYVAISDPENVHAIDELRIATRYQIELGVAPAEDILAELQRLDRVSDAIANATFEAEEAADYFGSDSELEADDGVSDAPIVRLV